jgi:hypothetical protein
LAGEAADEEINTANVRFAERPRARPGRSTIQFRAFPRQLVSFPVSACQSNVIGSSHSRPSGGEDALAEGIIFDLGNDGVTGSFKAKVETRRRPRRG